MSFTRHFNEFLENEKSGGILLIICTIISLIIANSSLASAYHRMWEDVVFGYSLETWINDGLMAIFFLLVGLELKREIIRGHLSNIKSAMLPTMAALGGILVPAGIYLIFNYGLDTHSGAGIPMATDIAFALGVLSLLGDKVPTSLKVFLTALAVIDDLGAIIVIALFYSADMSFTNLFISLGIFGVLYILNKSKVTSLIPYLIGGVLMWYFMHHSGVHATISGVLLAFVIPFGDGRFKSASGTVERALHRPVPFIILPLFALANTAITLEGNIGEVLLHHYSIGIAAGLIIGKPVGIFAFSYLSTKLGFSKIPDDINWSNIFYVGIFGGIGFTMSIFITLLAFDDPHITDNAKLAILVSSAVAAVLGLILLNKNLNKTKAVK